jgi:hypothetical protein
MGAPPHVTFPLPCSRTGVRQQGAEVAPSPARPVPKVFETPQDEASLFQIGPGPVPHSKGARYEFFKKCQFGIGDRP